MIRKCMQFLRGGGVKTNTLICLRTPVFMLTAVSCENAGSNTRYYLLDQVFVNGGLKLMTHTLGMSITLTSG